MVTVLHLSHRRLMVARWSLRVVDVGLSLTGVASPTEQEGQAVGTVCVGIALPGEAAFATTLRMPGQRDQMRQMSVISALDVLRRCLLAA